MNSCRKNSFGDLQPKKLNCQEPPVTDWWHEVNQKKSFSFV